MEPASAIAGPHRFCLVLVVEPDEALRDQIERYLALHGFFVMGASTASLANELANENAFDSLVADLSNRDDTSFELMRKLKETQSIGGVSISQYDDSFERFKSKSAGFMTHLKKPVDLALLVRALRKMFE